MTLTICAITVSSATCRIKVDFPPIFGPVNKSILGWSWSPILVSFGTKLSTLDMHGCRPSTMEIWGWNQGKYLMASWQNTTSKLFLSLFYCLSSFSLSTCLLLQNVQWCIFSQKSISPFWKNLNVTKKTTVLYTACNIKLFTEKPPVAIFRNLFCCVCW